MSSWRRLNSACCSLQSSSVCTHACCYGFASSDVLQQTQLTCSSKKSCHGAGFGAGGAASGSRRASNGGSTAASPAAAASRSPRSELSRITRPRTSFALSLIAYGCTQGLQPLLVVDADAGGLHR